MSEAPPAAPVRSVALLGGGVMGEAILAAVLRAGVPAGGVAVCERRAERADELRDRYGVRTTDDLADAVRGAEVVVVALKPGDVRAALTEVTDHLAPGAVVLSVAAGLTTAFYERLLPEGTPVLRVMPNTPALVGAGASAVAPGRSATPEHVATGTALLAATGLVVAAAEKDMDAVTAISGSGPAYVFALVDALAEAGVVLGLTRDRALELATATFRGAVALLDETGEHPVVLRERVTSPGGTTAAGLRQFDAHAVRAAVVAAAEAARDRSRALSAELEG
ncbi:pyrroline-5-carboxylate reductase [Cellulomonas carbonis]|uniref:Pyrroline-5-carboxylate reductase n=1 Tax=Cellulomonas carbonis T26 TaxID=947969 RepID=A0A0A0BVT2_9CELL|nr:pyrroline-5-carboxylate reductase [Cellulomonas carbonis]KGM11762.1 pyrroline-5-carboxylate reductase [Cellulomonas carbonis T26]GGC08948.1 pyrroline-5-carboxylate reductase [Cellulomonas carbonis]